MTARGVRAHQRGSGGEDCSLIVIEIPSPQARDELREVVI